MFLNSNKSNTEKVFQTEGISEAFALGILYVVEGSTLGGRFILKTFRNYLNFQEKKVYLTLMVTEIKQEVLEIFFEFSS